MSSSPILDLPSELRQLILQHALLQRGTVELQQPVWTGYSDYIQPLFHVCKSLRQEALEAFYTANDFLWIIDADQLRSDPSAYPYERHGVAGKPIAPEHPVEPLTAILPWRYPHLFQHLRHLQVNLYLPSESGAPQRIPGGPSLKEHLTNMVKVLVNGRRLSDFHVLITGKRRAPQMPLSDGEREALELLAQMRVRGSVDVQTRYYFRGVSQGLQQMKLKERMVRVD